MKYSFEMKSKYGMVTNIQPNKGKCTYYNRDLHIIDAFYSNSPDKYKNDRDVPKTSGFQKPSKFM